MATTFEMSAEEEELAKKDRLVNAWLAAGEDASPGDVAAVTDASEAYASRIRSQMTAGEITEADVDEVRDDHLIDEYATRLEQLAQTEDEAEADGSESAEAEPPADEEPGQERAAPQQSPRQSSQQPPRNQAVQQQQPPRQHHAQAPPQGHYSQEQHPPQQGRQVQQSHPQDMPVAEGQTVPVEQLRELDEMLAFIQDEAHFELQNLPPDDRGAAAGKLFVAQQARDALHSIVDGDSQQ